MRNAFDIGWGVTALLLSVFVFGSSLDWWPAFEFTQWMLAGVFFVAGNDSIQRALTRLGI